MKKKFLGNSGIQIAPFALGGNVFGWTVDEQKSFKILDAFMAQAFNLIDTADVYSSWKPGNKGGESETIIGNWMKQRGNRNKVIIATKVGGDMGLGKKSLARDWIFKEVEASLSRLKTDYIDLYQSHWDDLSTPVEETLRAYDQLIKQGKVRTIGASNFSKERLAEAIACSEKNKLPRYETFQPRYNLYDRAEYEKEYMQLCVEKNLGVISYYSLASGFLTGKYRSEADLGKSARGGGIKNYLNPRGIRILDALNEVAKKYKATPATISLAWLNAQPGIAAPIASATNEEQLKELMKSVEIELKAEDLLKLNEASAWAVVSSE
jgi:aryl-alcohol dehydrogenase-like predicted oxidoreductase